MPDTLADPDWAANPMVVGEGGLRFYAGAPIVGEDGHAVGTVCVADHTARELDERQLRALSILARQTASHLELRRSSAELRRLAVHDALDRPARTARCSSTASARRSPSAAAPARDVGVLFCDLDGFKAINDCYGHDAGDAVLRAVAERMAARPRAGDTVARLSGDELVVVCPGLSDAARPRPRSPSGWPAPSPRPWPSARRGSTPAHERRHRDRPRRRRPRDAAAPRRRGDVRRQAGGGGRR